MSDWDEIYEAREAEARFEALGGRVLSPGVVRQIEEALIRILFGSSNVHPCGACERDAREALALLRGEAGAQ